MTRTINAPGIEYNEIDRSQYNLKQDNSIVGTTSFICGFADKGEDYTTQWINSVQTLQETYGVPTNEPEKYFYNAGVEILNKGGILLMSKLPYDNESKDKFTYVDYEIDSNLSDLSSTDFSQLSSLDNYLEKIINIKNKTSNNETITLNKLDELITGKRVDLIKNKIRIVDITRSQYTSVETNCVSSNIEELNILNEQTNDCLGIVPVIVTPINALYFQNNESPELSNLNLSNYNPLNSLSSRSNVVGISTDLLQLSTHFSIPLSSNSILDETLSKIAANLFPNILYLNNGHFDSLHLKDITIAVFRAYRDPSIKTNVTFKLLEAFSGSLDKNSKDPINKSSRFIEDIVNSQSQYIRLFSNIDQNLVKMCSTIGIANQTAMSLGFYSTECRKIINYQDSIVKPLETILNANRDRNITQIDLVVDAGTSTLAQLAASNNNQIEFTLTTQIKDFSWNFDQNVSAWKVIQTKFDTFCKNTRKDCIFIADGLRTFCIDGDSKIVRSTNINNTIDNSIIPKLRQMTCLNSSYSVGYCNWFYGIDTYSGDLFWIPPSIKAAGIYTYTDAYFHKWDAPAGMTRGVVNNVVDCAFSPNIHEAGKIYQQCWNYAINYPLDGIVLEGQKTMQLQQTAFDRVNVRRLFLYLEKQVARYAKYFLYEGNTAYLRQRFVDTIRPIFEDAVNGNGILQYFIKCDDENNTTHTIENNELHCQIIVKPVKTIEFIVLDFVCTNQSADVTETILSK